MSSVKFRRSYMTLLETLIAMTLLSIVLVFVFALFRELADLSKLTEEAQKASFQMRYAESRLAYIFERILNEKDKTKRDFFFYTQPPQREFSNSQSLIFSYDNGVRINPTFSGDVLARLYVDFKNQLCLAIWPMRILEPQKHLHEEVLLDGVSDIKFTFYSPNDPRDNNPIKKPTGEGNQWLEEWAFKYNQMPCIIKINVQMKNNSEDSEEKKSYLEKPKTLMYSFVLPSSKNPITFP